MLTPRHAATLAAVAMIAASIPASADRSRTDILDKKGLPFGATWKETGRYYRLTVAGMDDVRVTSGEAWRIRASGDGRALGQLRFMNEKGTLVIGRISSPRERYGKVRIEVIAPSLRGLTTAGSGTVDVASLSGPRISAVVAGSGAAIVRRIQTDRMDATVAGSGGLTLAGRSGRADITIAGSGGLAAQDFTARTAAITIAGSGAARLRSPGPVTATIIGSGNAYVAGTTECRQTRMGSGRLLCTR